MLRMLYSNNMVGEMLLRYFVCICDHTSSKSDMLSVEIGYSSIRYMIGVLSLGNAKSVLLMNSFY